MIDIAVNGACGRMGARVCTLALEQRDKYRLVAAIEHDDHPAAGRDIGETMGLAPIGVAITNQLVQRADILIDFSLPASLTRRVEECLKTGTSLLVGTTGLTQEQHTLLREASRSIPCLVAANMSPGANLLAGLASKAAQALGPEYDVEIIEAHHRFKKDAPSGTALFIADTIAAMTGKSRQCLKCGRGKQSQPRTAQEIGIHSVRAGDIVGDHTVIMSNLGERIELIHRVHSRDVFARGALRAAEYLAKAKPGMYSIAHVIGMERL